jgi:bacteriophage HK97-gp10 putative tail-component
MATAQYRINTAQLYATLRDPNGSIARELYRMGLRVETRAKENLERAPRRVDTGRLRNSIHTVMTTSSGQLVVRVGTGVYYARWVHDGTGLYGPHHMRIRPVRAGALRFVPKGATRAIFRRSVAGMRPNKFLVDALDVLKH